MKNRPVKKREWEDDRKERGAVGRFFSHPLVIILVVILIALMLIGQIRFGNVFRWIWGGEGKTQTITEADLVRTLEISELSTVEYAYNSIAIAYKDNGDDIRYYVSYDGIVKAGIDFKDVQFVIDDKKKVINIKLPAVKILDTSVNIGSMDFIFTKKKYETETISQEGYKLCLDDLNDKAMHEEQLLEYARENSKAAIEGLIKPFIESVDAEYIIKWSN